MLAEYKLRSRDLFTDLDLGALLFLKGKIPILPERVKDMRQVKELYRMAGQ
jgi:heterodisulfide reductase subunit C